MAKIGNGYGSECHLLRWMGRHRNAFDRHVITALGSSPTECRMEWFDFDFDDDPKKDGWFDAELKGLEIPSESKLTGTVQDQWRAFWPVGRGIMNWDAIGRLWTGKNYELVLIEAKANIAEIGSDCKAVPGSPGWKQIRHAFQQVITDIGVTSTPDKWMHGYYQAANRMAVLWFLRRQGVPARLLCIYFTGDLVRPGAICPSSWGDWAAPLGRQDAHLGVAGVRHHVLDRVHKLPLSVMRI